MSKGKRPSTGTAAANGTTPVPVPPKGRGRRPYRPKRYLTTDGGNLLKSAMSLRSGTAYALWLKGLAAHAKAGGMALDRADMVARALADYARRIGYASPPDRLEP